MPISWYRNYVTVPFSNRNPETITTDIPGNQFRLRVGNTFAPPCGNFRDNVFSGSPMSGEYFDRLIATGERDVCLLSSCSLPSKYFSLKVYILSSDNNYMMYFGVNVQEIDLLRRKISFVKNYKSYVCHRRYETTLL